MSLLDLFSQNPLSRGQILDESSQFYMVAERVKKKENKP